MTDEELVEASRSGGGSSQAFDELVSRHQGRIMANCRYISKSPNDAEDLAQEVFVKAFFALPRFEARSSFKTWLQRIKINHCLNHLDKKRGKVFVDAEEPGLAAVDEMRVQPRAERDLKSIEDRERIEIILDDLSEALRVPLVLREVDGLSYQEIADHLEISLSAAKMRIKRAREAFRNDWEQLEREARYAGYEAESANALEEEKSA
ncbi:MAG: sigma-70 family RNA polymerase sigma factor [Acidobacteriota bacterium]